VYLNRLANALNLNPDNKKIKIKLLRKDKEVVEKLT